MGLLALSAELWNPQYSKSSITIWDSSHCLWNCGIHSTSKVQLPYGTPRTVCGTVEFTVPQILCQGHQNPVQKLESNKHGLVAPVSKEAFIGGISQPQGMGHLTFGRMHT